MTNETAEKLLAEVRISAIANNGIPILSHDEAQWIINKVLDAVCMEVNNVGLGAHNTLATKTAINKLRPKP